MVLAEDLRQAVLQAALQGKLTEQLETDSNVDEMLVTIPKEKVQFIADKKTRKEELLPQIREEDILFDIPDGWRWEKVGKLVEIKNGFTPKRTDETLWNPKEIPWFTVEDIHNQGLVIYHTAQAISRKALGKTDGRIIPPHTVLLCCTSATIGRYAMTEIELTTNQQWNGLVIKKEYKHIICSDYILVWVSSLKEKMTEIAKSTTFPFLSIDKLANFVIPLPPIEEQQRIVDKINEIMPKIKEYEKIEKELEELKKEFPTNMKDALLQAAMQGKLTEQLESDSSVDELLISIQKEKEELIAQKKIKKEKPLPDIKGEEVPFDIPENWKWVRLNEIGEIIGGGTPKTSQMEFWNNGNIPWITPADMNGCDKYIEAGEKNITQLGLDNSSAQLFPKGSVILSSRAPIGYISIAQNEASTSQGCKTFSAYLQDIVLSEYIYYAMLFRMSDMKKRATGTTFKEISGKGVGETMIPFPPIEEQHRIVERLDALLPLCEDLKEE